MLSRDIFGLPIPDAGPVFAVALAVHIAAGLTAVTAGALAATAVKRAGRHWLLPSLVGAPLIWWALRGFHTRDRAPALRGGR